jgi:hypothetical protein
MHKQEYNRICPVKLQFSIQIQTKKGIYFIIEKKIFNQIENTPLLGLAGVNITCIFAPDS